MSVLLIQSFVLINIFSNFLGHTEKKKKRNFGVIMQPIFLILLLLASFYIRSSKSQLMHFGRFFSLIFPLIIDSNPSNPIFFFFFFCTKSNGVRALFLFPILKHLNNTAHLEPVLTSAICLGCLNSCSLFLLCYSTYNLFNTAVTMHYQSTLYINSIIN